MPKALLSVLLLAPSICTAADDIRTAADMFPARCLAFAEMSQPSELKSTLLTHPVWEAVKDRQEYKQIAAGPQYLFFQAIVANVEGKMGMSWQEAYDAVLGGGIAAAFDPQTEGAAAVIRMGDEKKARQVVTALIELARADAREKGKPDPIPVDEYRDITIYGQKNGRVALLGPWIVFASKDDLGRELVDTWLDGKKDSLSDNERFQQARQTQERKAPTVWSWVDIGTLRDAGVAEKLKEGRADNFGVELLFGGVLSTLRQTPFVTGSFSIEKESTSLEFVAPHKSDWVEEAREYWFGPDGKGAAPSLITSDETVFSLSTYRKVSDMWLRAGDLFDEKTNDQLAQADSTLATLFSGKDFGEDILGSFGPGLRLIVNRQDFTDRLPKPAIRIPSFALTGTLLDPDETQVELRRIFQSMVGFLNVVGSMEGNPQLDQDIELHEKAKIYKASFVAEPDEKKSERARIQFNFSPSLAFAGDQFILSSTTELARELSDVVTSDGARGPSSPNTVFTAPVPAISRILDDNREQLIAKNMLEEGHSREEAENRIGILFSVLELFSDLNFDLATTGGTIRARLELNSEKSR